MTADKFDRGVKQETAGFDAERRIGVLRHGVRQALLWRADRGQRGDRRHRTRRLSIGAAGAVRIAYAVERAAVASDSARRQELAARPMRPLLSLARALVSSARLWGSRSRCCLRRRPAARSPREGAACARLAGGDGWKLCGVARLGARNGASGSGAAVCAAASAAASTRHAASSDARHNRKQVRGTSVVGLRDPAKARASAHARGAARVVNGR